MSEPNEEQEKKMVKVRLEKHLWPEERAKKASRRKNIIFVCLLIVAVVVSFGLGYKVKETTITSTADTPVVSTTQDTYAISKLKLVNEILTKKWYFGEDTSDFSEGLVEKAILGMVDNDTDIHTSYMTLEEAEQFTSSIDMGFVGIGVQFTTADNLNMIQKVFADSPAEKAGVQVGDIIYKVEGVIIDDTNNSDIASMVKGEEGTTVHITFLRQNEEIELDIVRGQVENSAYGKMINDHVGYLEIDQFGSTTADTIKNYLDDMTFQGMDSLIIDLRDNGGGYLATLVDIASFFLPEGTVCIQQEYRDGTVEVSKTNEGYYENINGIVILINGNSASASEVLTTALMEQRNDVTVIGVTSYGKGTAQVSRTFSDGTVLKYTTSRWLSPEGNWVNGVGITPDEEVRLHDALYQSYPEMAEDATYEMDCVSEYVYKIQLLLDFLNYDVDRMDGYFDQSTADALVKFKESIGEEATPVLNKTTYEAMISAAARERALNELEVDTQLIRAIEILDESDATASFNHIEAEGNVVEMSEGDLAIEEVSKDEPCQNNYLS